MHTHVHFNIICNTANASIHKPTAVDECNFLTLPLVLDPCTCMCACIRTHVTIIYYRYVHTCTVFNGNMVTCMTCVTFCCASEIYCYCLIISPAVDMHSIFSLCHILI